MRIAVIGSGAIGCLVAAYLKDKKAEVTLIGHGPVVGVVARQGIAVSGARGDLAVRIDIAESLNYIPDLVILATKTQDIDSALADCKNLLQNALLLTTQNGVQAEKIASKYLAPEQVISSIVMFGSTNIEPGKVVHNFEGSWILGSVFGQLADWGKIEGLVSVLSPAFPVVIAKDITGMKYLKIFLNANNCLPAILGKSMQEVFSDLSVSQISIAIWKEAQGIFNQLNLGLASLPGFPLENLTKLTSLPIEKGAEIFSGMMQNLSREPLYGSILQSIMRGKLSEIDYINGEFVNLARAHHLSAPLNTALVEMVHEVEKTRRFYSKEELIAKTKELI